MQIIIAPPPFKRIIFSVLTVFCFFNTLFAQLKQPRLQCEMDHVHSQHEEKNADAQFNYASPNSLPICNDPTSTKVIRVNIHFMANNDGSGNFRESHDGLGNTNYNGYMFAEDVINRANLTWANQDNGAIFPWLYSGTVQPNNPPFRIRLILTGVYFHNDSYYNSVSSLNDFGLNNIYGVDKLNTINMYFSGFQNFSGSGEACWYCSTTGRCASGQSIRLYNPWDIYRVWRPDMNWILTYASGTVVHELGHIFNLQHDWGSDLCNDTPPHNNCWGLTPSNPNCDTWAEMSNNLMSYSSYGAALTPCQVDRCHSCLNTTLNNYIHSCSGCVPANAYFVMGETYCRQSTNHPFDVTIDARGTFNETTYAIEIFEVASMGSNTSIGNYYSGQFSGQIGVTNLRTAYGYNFAPNKYYRVKLSAINSCLPQSDMIKWVNVQDACPLPPPPNPKNLYVEQYGELVKIRVSEMAIVNVALYDLSGRSIWSMQQVQLLQGENVLTIPSELVSGIYLLSFHGTKGVETHKIVINK